MSEQWELWLFLSGISDDEYEHDYQLFELLADKYGLTDYSGLINLIDDLTETIEIGESPLTKKRYKGFANNGIWLHKKEVKQSEK